jgi:hypothetical protein
MVERAPRLDAAIIVAGGNNDNDSLWANLNMALADTCSCCNDLSVKALSCAETTIEVCFECVQAASRRVSDFASF